MALDPKQATAAQRAASDINRVFRRVPRTGVIFVMGEARKLGFCYGHPDWANLGQGAPETGDIAGANPGLTSIELDEASREYGPVMGLPDLRAAVAELYNKRYRVGMASQYTAENVAISSGGRSGLTRLVAAMGSIHLGHMLPDYTAYEELLESFRAFVPVPILVHAEDRFRLAPRELRRNIVGMGLGALLFSNPCNPTGTVVRGAEMATWVDISRDAGCALIIDEFYGHYLYGEAARAYTSVSATSHVEDVNQDMVVVVDGLTKNWRYPGWRLSWTLGPKTVIERVASAGSFLDGGPPHPLQRAAIPLVDKARADTEARAIQATFGAKRDLMIKHITSEAIGMQLASPPEGAFYCFADLSKLPPPLNEGMSFFRRALEHKVICVPGEFFDVNPGHRRSHIPSRLRSWVRLSFGPNIDTVRLGMQRFEKMVAEAKTKG